MEKQYVVIGLGRFGSSIAKTLYEMGKNVLAIDEDYEKVSAMMDFSTHCVQADASDPEVLKSLGLRNYDVAVIAIGNDIESNVMTTMLVKDLGIKYIVAKAINDVHGKILQRIGADRVVFPERSMGVRVAHNLVYSNILDAIDISPEYSIMEVAASEPLIGKTLGDLNLRAKHKVNIIAIKKGDDKSNIILSPGADSVIHEGDLLIAIGKESSLKGFNGDV